MSLQSAKSTADNLADKNIDSTDTELRYAAYGARLRTALRASHRYFAYVRPIPSFRSTRTSHDFVLPDQ
jgi:fission process protein 1